MSTLQPNIINITSYMIKRDNKGKFIKGNYSGQLLDGTQGIKSQFKIGNKFHLKSTTKYRKGVVHKWKEWNPLSLRVKRLEKIAGRAKPTICELCGLNKKRICFDHNHATGKFRGWICARCNGVLGYVKEDKTLLKKMINYLI